MSWSECFRAVGSDQGVAQHAMASGEVMHQLIGVMKAEEVRATPKTAQVSDDRLPVDTRLTGAVEDIGCSETVCRPLVLARKVARKENRLGAGCLSEQLVQSPSVL